MATITTSVGSPGTVSAASGGRIYAFNDITTTSQQIVEANAQRQSVTIHNPGTVDVFVAPIYVIVDGADYPLIPSTSALGGCVRVLPGSTMQIVGECQKAWQAFSATGSGNPLTVVDSNI